MNLIDYIDEEHEYAIFPRNNLYALYSMDRPIIDMDGKEYGVFIQQVTVAKKELFGILGCNHVNIYKVAPKINHHTIMCLTSLQMVELDKQKYTQEDIDMLKLELI